MSRKAREHFALILPGEMEKAVPCYQTVKSSAQIQLTHVGGNPLRFRKTTPAQLDHRRGGVDTQDVHTTLQKVASDRFTHTAAEIENGRPQREKLDEPIEPRLLEQGATAVMIIGRGMPFVEPDDLPGIVHWSDLLHAGNLLSAGTEHDCGLTRRVKRPLAGRRPLGNTKACPSVRWNALLRCAPPGYCAYRHFCKMPPNIEEGASYNQSELPSSVL